MKINIQIENISWEEAQNLFGKDLLAKESNIIIPKQKEENIDLSKIEALLKAPSVLMKSASQPSKAKRFSRATEEQIEQIREYVMNKKTALSLRRAVIKVRGRYSSSIASLVCEKYPEVNKLKDKRRTMAKRVKTLRKPINTTKQTERMNWIHPRAKLLSAAKNMPYLEAIKIVSKEYEQTKHGVAI